MKLFRSILALLGIRVKVSVPGGSCPYCGARRRISGYADLQCTSRAPGEAYAGMVGRYVSLLCVHAFKGLRCGYSGAATVCDHTMATCQSLANFARYGGWPSWKARCRYSRR